MQGATDVIQAFPAGQAIFQFKPRRMSSLEVGNARAKGAVRNLGNC